MYVKVNSSSEQDMDVVTQGDIIVESIKPEPGEDVKMACQSDHQQSLLPQPDLQQPPNLQTNRPSLQLISLPDHPLPPAENCQANHPQSDHLQSDHPQSDCTQSDHQQSNHQQSDHLHSDSKKLDQQHVSKQSAANASTQEVQKQEFSSVSDVTSPALPKDEMIYLSNTEERSKYTNNTREFVVENVVETKNPSGNSLLLSNMPDPRAVTWMGNGNASQKNLINADSDPLIETGTWTDNCVAGRLYPMPPLSYFIPSSKPAKSATNHAKNAKLAKHASEKVKKSEQTGDKLPAMMKKVQEKRKQKTKQDNRCSTSSHHLEIQPILTQPADGLQGSEGQSAHNTADGKILFVCVDHALDTEKSLEVIWWE